MKFIKGKHNFIGFLSVTILTGVAILIAAILAKNTIIQKSLCIDSEDSGVNCSAVTYYVSSTGGCNPCP